MPQSTRWTAGILSLVMLASAFVPIALGQSMQSSGMHCLRRKNIAPDKMPCHGAMEKESVANDAMAEDAPSPASSNENDEPSLQSAAECCGNHDCCCRIGSSERERILPVPLSAVALTCNRTTPFHNFLLDLRVVSERDSARAPPV
jgi:hypothetical protein